MSNYYKLVDGEIQPATLEEWAETYEKPGLRNIAFDKVATPRGDIVDVSTVFLGLDHGFGADGPPVLFETMAFGIPADHSPDRQEDYQWRYTSVADAKAGHIRVVQAIEKGEPLH